MECLCLLAICYAGCLNRRVITVSCCRQYVIELVLQSFYLLCSAQLDVLQDRLNNVVGYRAFEVSLLKCRFRACKVDDMVVLAQIAPAPLITRSEPSGAPSLITLTTRRFSLSFWIAGSEQSAEVTPFLSLLDFCFPSQVHVRALTADPLSFL